MDVGRGGAAFGDDSSGPSDDAMDNGRDDADASRRPVGDEVFDILPRTVSDDFAAAGVLGTTVEDRATEDGGPSNALAVVVVGTGGRARVGSSSGLEAVRVTAGAWEDAPPDERTADVPTLGPPAGIVGHPGGGSGGPSRRLASCGRASLCTAGL